MTRLQMRETKQHIFKFLYALMDLKDPLQWIPVTIELKISVKAAKRSKLEDIIKESKCERRRQHSRRMLLTKFKSVTLAWLALLLWLIGRSWKNETPTCKPKNADKSMKATKEMMQTINHRLWMLYYNRTGSNTFTSLVVLFVSSRDPSVSILMYHFLTFLIHWRRRRILTNPTLHVGIMRESNNDDKKQRVPAQVIKYPICHHLVEINLILSIKMTIWRHSWNIALDNYLCNLIFVQLQFIGSYCSYCGQSIQ